MPMPFTTDLHADAELVRGNRHGTIEIVDGRFCRIVFRRWPKIVLAAEAAWLGAWLHERRQGDRLLVYYDQPRRMPNYLAVKYLLSHRQTSMASACRAIEVLDEIARIKRSDATLCDAMNLRLSTRLLGRWGFEPHCPSRWHRHFIKRYYGSYPPRADWLAAGG